MRANGPAIKVIRQRTGISLRDLERATGIHRGYLSELERGLKDARHPTLREIAKALGTTADVITRSES